MVVVDGDASVVAGADEMPHSALLVSKLLIAAAVMRSHGAHVAMRAAHATASDDAAAARAGLVAATAAAVSAFAASLAPSAAAPGCHMPHSSLPVPRLLIASCATAPDNQA